MSIQSAKRERERQRQRDRQTDRQAQTGRQTDRHTKTDKQTNSDRESVLLSIVPVGLQGRVGAVLLRTEMVSFFRSSPLTSWQRTDNSYCGMVVADSLPVPV